MANANTNPRIARIIEAWDSVCAGIGRDAESAADATDRLAALLRRAGAPDLADAAQEYADSLRGLEDHEDEAVERHDRAQDAFLALAFPG